MELKPVELVLAETGNGAAQFAKRRIRCYIQVTAFRRTRIRFAVVEDCHSLLRTFDPHFLIFSLPMDLALVIPNLRRAKKKPVDKPEAKRARVEEPVVIERIPVNAFGIRIPFAVLPAAEAELERSDGAVALAGLVALAQRQEAEEEENGSRTHVQRILGGNASAQKQSRALNAPVERWRTAGVVVGVEEQNATIALILAADWSGVQVRVVGDTSHAKLHSVVLVCGGRVRQNRHGVISITSPGQILLVGGGAAVGRCATARCGALVRLKVGQKCGQHAEEARGRQLSGRMELNSALAHVPAAATSGRQQGGRKSGGNVFGSSNVSERRKRPRATPSLAIQAKSLLTAHSGRGAQTLAALVEHEEPGSVLSTSLTVASSSAPSAALKTVRSTAPGPPGTFLHPNSWQLNAASVDLKVPDDQEDLIDLEEDFSST